MLHLLDLGLLSTKLLSWLRHALELHWVELGDFWVFFGGGKEESIGGCFGGKIGMDMGDLTCYIIWAHLRSFRRRENMQN